VSRSKLLLIALVEEKASGCQRIITRDESWFFLYYPRDLVWAVLGDELPQHSKQKIDTEKCLVSILWLVSGIYGLLDVPKGTTYNTAFFMDVACPV
jgi:hypothetical protein